MIIDGKKIASDLEKDLQHKLKNQPRKSVAFVLFGNDPASLQFIGIKSRVAERLGINTKTIHIADIESTQAALKVIHDVIDQNYDGIVVQLPLPNHLDAQKILDIVPVDCDVDVLGTTAKQSYEQGLIKRIPPVAKAVDHILNTLDITLEGKKIIIIGNGKLVGQPVQVLLLHKNIPYQVIDEYTLPNEREQKIKNADIIISGAGVPHMITPEMIKKNVILIDAGTSEQGGKLAGDIDPRCAEKAFALTPVPGGVGPITVVSLFENLLE